MHWDGTITLGAIIQIVSMVLLAIAGFNALSARLGNFETTIKDHADTLDKLDGRLTAVGDRYTALAGQLQRLIGRSEVSRYDRYDRE